MTSSYTTTTITTNNEVTDMTTTDISIDLAAADVATHESHAVNRKALITDAKASFDAAKIDAYGVVCATITKLKLKKGTKRAGEFRAAMEANGISTACAKRYAEIGAAAVSAKIFDVTDRCGDTALDFNDLATEISISLRNNGIETEAALKAACFPKVEKALVEKLVDLALAGSDDEEAAVQALLDAAAAINSDVRDVAATLLAALKEKNIARSFKSAAA